MPGIFMHRGYTWHRIVTYLTTDIYGIYGTSVKVAATYIVLFIIFGEVMNKCGMGQFFNDIANALAGHTKGGPAKVAVLASGFLGSINGSAVANVVTTGTFTIPLMKKTGYSKEFAGSVEPRPRRRAAASAHHGRGGICHGGNAGRTVRRDHPRRRHSRSALLRRHPRAGADARDKGAS